MSSGKTQGLPARGSRGADPRAQNLGRSTPPLEAMPMTEPPESFQGTRLPSRAPSDASDAQPSLLALGAQQAAAQLQRALGTQLPGAQLPGATAQAPKGASRDGGGGSSAAVSTSRGVASSGSSTSADGGAAGKPPVHLVFRREVTWDVPPDQVEDAVAAIVHMQPLPPVSPRSSSPAVPASPCAVALQQAAPSSPEPGWRVLEDRWHAGQGGQEQRQQQAAGSEGSAGEEEEAKYESAESDAFESSSSSSSLGTSPTAAAWAGPAPGAAAVAGGLPPPLHPTVPPPPRPATVQQGTAIPETNGSLKRDNATGGAAPAQQAVTEAGTGAAMQQRQQQQPVVQHSKPALPAAPAGAAGSRGGGPASAPSSPATPPADQQGRPRRQGEGAPLIPDLAAASPLAAGQGEQAPAAQAAASGPASWSPAGPGAVSPWRQLHEAPPPPSPPQQAQQPRWAPEPQRRSRLSVGATAAAPAPEPEGSQVAVPPLPAPSRQQPGQPAGTSRESRVSAFPAAVARMAASAVRPVPLPEPAAAGSTAATEQEVSSRPQPAASASSRITGGRPQQQAVVGQAGGASEEAQAPVEEGEEERGPQLTEIRGPWPPPPSSPPSAQASASAAAPAAAPSAPSGAEADSRSPSTAVPLPVLAPQPLRRPSGGLGLRSAFQPAQQRWRQLDDGSWHEPVGDVDWDGGGTDGGTGGGGAFGLFLDQEGADVAGYAGASMAPAQQLLGSPLVTAASQSPPLSPTSTRLLALKQHHPGEPPRRGPQRAASLGLGIAPSPERQPSLLSPVRQQSLKAQPLPPFSSPPLSPSGRLVTERLLQQQPQPLGQLPEEALTASSSGGSAQASSGSTGGSIQPGGTSWPAPAPAELAPPLPQQERLPVLNASPDVTASASLAAPPSPFPARPTSAPPASGSGGRQIGGLPVEVVVEKRERHRFSSASDLSPREAYTDAQGWQADQLRLPLLPRLQQRESDSREWSAQEEPGSTARLAVRSKLWSSTALLASAMLGAGFVAVPRAFALMGLVAGSISLAVVALLALVAAQVLIRASATAEGHHWWCYADAARAALGPTSAALTNIALAVNCFGVMVASLVVLGDVLVGTDSSEGLLGNHWEGARGTALSVLAVVVLAPLVSFRDLSAASGTGRLAAVGAGLAAATTLALLVNAARQHATHHMRTWPDWRQLSGDDGAGWFERMLELLAVVPVLLVALLCHPALHSVMCHLRPYSPVRMTGATSTALVYCSSLAALLGLCCYSLFGTRVQANALMDFSPEALVPLAGDSAGRGAFLLVRLAFVIALVAGFPLQMGPFRDCLWQVLFWQPLRGAGFYLVTYLSLAAALWASLRVASLWTLLSMLGATSGALLALVLPGLVSIRLGGAGHRTVGAVLLVGGLVVAAAGILKLALYGSV